MGTPSIARTIPQTLLSRRNSAHDVRKKPFDACVPLLVLSYNIETRLKRLPAVFFRLAAGREPVRDWLRNDLSLEDRKIVGDDLRDLEFVWPVGLPLCRSLGNGLWEVRSNLTSGKIGRVIFCVHAGQAVLLHGFIKKTQKTPKPDMDLAMRRKKEVEQ